MDRPLYLILLFTAAFVAIILLIMLAVLIWKRYKKKDILSMLNPKRKWATRLFELEFGRHNVFSGVYLPIYEGKRVTSFVFADTIIILPGCIVVCRLRDEAGLIYCEDGFDWHQSARVKGGNTIERDFIDPVLQNDEAVSALRALFARAKIEEPDIYRAVIFAAKSVSFSIVKPNVYSLIDAYDQLKMLARGEKLPKESLMAYRRLIATKAVKKGYAERFNAAKSTKIT